MMILIAGPYRSGTDDDPKRIAANVHAMTEMALRVFRADHLPVIGEWYRKRVFNRFEELPSA